MMNLPEPCEQRFFLAFSVFGSRLAKVTQGGFECVAGVIGQRRINYRGHALERSEKHFDTSMTLKQEACGI